MSTGVKRKRDKPPKFYAVRTGARPGVYHTWADCLSQVNGFKNALYKSFGTMAEAESFVKHGPSRLPTSAHASKFYAVRGGRQPGVYTDWLTVQNLIQGWKGVKQKSFSTRAEADAFVRGEARPASDAVEESKRKKSRKSTTVFDDIAGNEIDKSVPAGYGPMPPIAQDGFDPNIKLNAKTGEVEYKSTEERNRFKMQAKGLSDEGTLTIYTDGSSLGNGSHGATAGVGVYFGPRDPRNLSEALEGPRQTNQRAELTAIMRALHVAPLDRDVLIYSDSNYSIKCVTEWFVNWRRNGWVNANKKPVENRDLIEKTLARIEERHTARAKTNFRWLKGHADDPGNVAADSLAVDGARAARAALDDTGE